jgi:hypothetical protein
MILFNFLIFILLSSFVIAQEAQKKQEQDQEQKKEQVQSGEQAKAQEKQKFVDLDGDGFNDNAPDHDGDGIPNGLDPDWQKQQNQEFVDLDGDGINDNMMQNRLGQSRQMFGPGSNAQEPKGTPQIKSEEQQQKGKKGKRE